jgi:DNA-binding NarL/FixJ family response regulator
MEVMLFTGERNEKLVRAAFDAGARSYLVKTDTAAHFVAAIEALGNHKPYFTPDVSEIVFRRFTEREGEKSGASAGEDLSVREREILKLLVDGCSNKEVASNLGISPKTVEGHRSAMMHKLKLKAFSELVRWAIRNKVVEA